MWTSAAIALCAVALSLALWNARMPAGKHSPHPLSAAWRATEFPALQHCVFLDFAGTALASRSQIRATAEELMDGTTLLANPHSGGPASMATHQRIEQARRTILEWCGADRQHYAVVFTASATASLRLVAQCFPWSAGAGGSELRTSHECHNSMLGMRQHARAAGAAVSTFRYCASACSDASAVRRGREHGPGAALLAFPAECNATGARRPYERLTRQAHDAGWRVLLDASKFASTAKLHLGAKSHVHGAAEDDAAARAAHLPDFVVFSFYKLFGAPTGLGALLVRRDNGASRILHAGKTYWGGGAIAAANASPHGSHVPRADSVSAYLEDGTPSFHAIAALAHGFDALRTVGGIDAIAMHTHALALRLAEGLAHLTHHSGERVARLLGGWETILAARAKEAVVEEAGKTAPRTGACESSHRTKRTTLLRQGPVVAFTLFAPDPARAAAATTTTSTTASGTATQPRALLPPPEARGVQPPIRCAAVNRICSLHGIHIRTGCFCNPGACEVELKLTGEEVTTRVAALRRKSSAAASAHSVCWDDSDLLSSDAGDVHAGACRASLGYPSTQGDVDALLAVLRATFCARPSPPAVTRVWPLAATRENARGKAQACATPSRRARIDAIYVYPVKSCAPMRVCEWNVDVAGFLFDRHWAVVERSVAVGHARKSEGESAARRRRVVRPGKRRAPIAAGAALLRAVDEECPRIAWSAVALSQKQLATLARIVPSLDLKRAQLTLRCPSTDAGRRAGALCVPLEPPLGASGSACAVSFANGSAMRRAARAYTDRATLAWFRTVCGRACTLAVRMSGNGSGGDGDDVGGGGFVNDGALLIVSRASVRQLSGSLPNAQRARCTDFRPNIVVASAASTDASPLQPHDEDNWREVRVSDGSINLAFDVTAPCSRCRMVDIGNQLGNSAGNTASSLMRVLSEYRRKRASILFGVYARPRLFKTDPRKRTAHGENEAVNRAGGVAQALREGMLVDVVSLGPSFFDGVAPQKQKKRRC